jgi:hypothetical protein
MLLPSSDQCNGHRYSRTAAENAFETAAPLCTARPYGLGSHFFALLSTGEASFGTALAMIRTVFLAFFATGTADLSTNSAQFSGILAATGHECCCHTANLSAIHV